MCDLPFVACHRLRNIYSRNVHDLNIDLYNLPMSNVNISIERPHATSYVLVIAMSVLSVIACEIITYELAMNSMRIFYIENG